MSEQDEGTRTCEGCLKEFWKSIALVSRTLIGVSILLFLAGFIFTVIPSSAVCIPLKVIYSYHFHRLFTAVYIQTGILALLIELLLFITKASEHEREIGTVRYALFFVLNSFLVQVVFVFVMWVLSFKIEEMLVKMSNGLISMIMLEIVYESMKEPFSYRQLPFCRVKLRCLYYPFLVFIIALLLGFDFFLLLIGMGMGYANSYKLLNCLFYLSPERAERCERSCLFSKLRELGPFCRHARETGSTAEVVDNVRVIQPQAKREPFQAFAGSGVQVGRDKEVKRPEATPGEGLREVPFRGANPDLYSADGYAGSYDVLDSSADEQSRRSSDVLPKAEGDGGRGAGAEPAEKQDN